MDPTPTRPFLARFLAICGIAFGVSATAVAGPIQMQFVAVNGTQAFGDYVGPYSGTMNGAPVDLFCVDFANEVGFGQRWDANLSLITADADLSDTRYGTTPRALELYQQAAWLTIQFTSQPTNEFGDIQATIWQLFNPIAPTPSTGWWLEQARRNYSSVDYGDFRVVTNLGPVQQSGQIQEFLTRTQSGDAPEPNTQLLVGIALAGVAGICRRRRRRLARSM